MRDDYLIHDDTEEVLTPSYHGELCRRNGDNPDYEIACDECDYYLLCFPDWEEMFEIFDMNSKRIDSIITSPNEALEIFLRANARKAYITDLEKEIIAQVENELVHRKKRIT